MPKTTAQVLTEEALKIVAPAIHSTWNYIASDAMQLEGRMTNAIALELCLDAGRLNNAQADRIINDAIKAVGYPTVLKYLNRKIRLI